MPQEPSPDALTVPRRWRFSLARMLAVLTAVCLVLGIVRLSWQWLGPAFAFATGIGSGWLMVSILVLTPAIVRVAYVWRRLRLRRRELLAWSEELRQSRRREGCYSPPGDVQAAVTAPRERR